MILKLTTVLLALVLYPAIVDGQTWVATADSVSTTGRVEITSSASDALSVTGGIQTTGVITGTRNENAISRNIFTNSSTGTGAAVVIDLANSSGIIGEIGVTSTGFTAGLSPSMLFFQSTAANGMSFGNTAGGPFTFSGGRINSNASQPGFLAYNSVSDNPTPGSTSTVDQDTEVYDNTSAFSADVFTAQVTGTYLLCASTSIAVGAGAGSSNLLLVTSNRTYTQQVIAPGATFIGDSCVPADMDAGDTAFVQFVCSGGVASCLVSGGGSPVNTYFSARLLP